MRDYLQLHLVVLAWGLTAVLGRLVTLPPWELVVYRTALASVGFAVLALCIGARLTVGWRVGVRLTAVGVLLGWHWILFFWSARLANASVCLAAMPTLMLWCSLLEPIIDGRRKWRAMELGMGVILVGAVWMMYRVQVEASVGFTVGLGAALFAALFSVVSKQLVAHWPSATLGFYQMVGACIGSAAALPFLAEKGGGWIHAPTLGDWGWLSILALFCTVAAGWGYLDALKRVSVFIANVMYNMEPIYGMVLAVAVFGSEEVLHPGFYAGVAIIVTSVTVIPMWERRRPILPLG